MMRVFLDAACWMAAAGNEFGGSMRILRLAQAGLFIIVVTELVLVEAERNMRDKMPAEAFQRYMDMQGMLRPEIIEPTTPEENLQWQDIITEKDCHVLAGAYKARADVLVTLDRKHILTDAVRQHFPIPVQDTKEFLAAFRQETE